MAENGYLALTRKVGESLVIDGGIEVMVAEVTGLNTVRIAIKAPREIKIMRKELLDAKT